MLPPLRLNLDQGDQDFPPGPGGASSASASARAWLNAWSVVGANPQAYTEGSVGWAATQARLRMPDGSEFPIRLTIVYHQEEGEWKVVQWHGSVGVGNEENFGEAIPT